MPVCISGGASVSMDACEFVGEAVYDVCTNVLEWV